MSLVRSAVAAIALTIVLPCVVNLTWLAHAEPTPSQTSACATERIVSIGGDATEILYALGCGDKIIAVDSTSLYPVAALKEKANVGYLRQLATEGVLSVGPGIIIASAQAGPPDVVRALQGAGIRYETLPGNDSAEKVAEKIRFVGKIVGADQKAEALASDVSKRFDALAEKRRSITKPIRAIFILGTSSGRAMLGGTGSTADTVMRLAGAENAAAILSGYKPLTDEALLSMAPDAIITIGREGANDTADRIAKLPGFEQTPAGKAKRVIVMDAHYLLGFGPRTPEAAEELMAALYPIAR